MNKIFEQLAALEFSRVIIIAVGVAFAYYMMVYDDGSQLKTSIAEMEQQLAEAQTKKEETDAALKQVQEMQQKIGQLSAKYESISSQLPAQLLSIDINRAIDDFARNAGVIVKAKKPAPEVRKNVVDEVPVEVTIEGSYAQLAQFVNLVSQSQRITRLTRIIITPPEGGDITNTRSLKMDGLVVGFKLAPPQAAPAIDPETGEPIPQPEEATQ